MRVRWMRGAWGAAILLTLLPGPVLAEPADDYGLLLAKSVKDDGIDYGELAAGRAALDGYVRSLEDADPGKTDALRVAFWINAFNALALQEAIDGRPEDARRAWRVARKDVTLGGIEEILVGFKEPLVHFALHRATRSSPPLSGVLYGANDLKAALLQQTRAYLTDAKWNLLEYAHLRAELSMVLLWHHEEFAAGRKGDVPPLQLFLADHLPKEADEQGKERESVIARSLRTTHWRISYRPYDGSKDEAGLKPLAFGPVWIALYGIVACVLLFLGIRGFGKLLRARTP